MSWGCWYTKKPSLLRSGFLMRIFAETFKACEALLVVSWIEDEYRPPGFRVFVAVFQYSFSVLTDLTASSTLYSECHADDHPTYPGLSCLLRLRSVCVVLTSRRVLQTPSSGTSLRVIYRSASSRPGPKKSFRPLSFRRPKIIKRLCREV